MAITKLTPTLVESASATSLTGTFPAGVTDGDLLFFHCVFTTATASFTGPGAGWTQLYAPLQTSGTANTVATYYKFYATGDAAPQASMSVANRCSVITGGWRGVDTTTPFSVSVVTTNDTTQDTAQIDLSGLTAVPADSMVVTGVGATFSTGQWTAPTGYATAVQNTSGVGRACGLSDLLKVGTGDTGTLTWPYSATASLAAGFVVALNPIGGAGVLPVTASAETEAFDITDIDPLDDAAIWVHPTDASLSTVIVTCKDEIGSAGGLYVYNLDGTLHQSIILGQQNNIDIRYNVDIDGTPYDVLASSNRVDQTIRFWYVDKSTRQLVACGSVASGLTDIYGLCMYKDGEQAYVFVTDNVPTDGRVQQWRIDQTTGTNLTATKVREWTMDTLCEGLCADDEYGFLYVAEELVGLWRYGARPGDSTDPSNGRSLVLSVSGGQTTAEVEGVDIYYDNAGGGYIIAVEQFNDRFKVLDRKPPHDVKHTFQIQASASIDGVTFTDGIAVTNRNLGTAFPQGLFVAHDDDNTTPGNSGGQNFKLVDWGLIAQNVAPNLTIDTTRDPRNPPEPSLNASASVPIGQTFRVRFEIQETLGVATASAYELRFSKNSGAYTQVTSGTDVRPATSGQFADGAATTDILPSSAGTFVAGVGDEVDAITPSISLGANGHTEIEFSLVLAGAAAAGNTFDLRVYKSGGTVLENYAFTPRITASTITHRSVGAVDQTSAVVAADVAGATAVRLKVATDATLTTNVMFGPNATPDGNGYAKMSISGLTAGTQYYFGIMVDDTVHSSWNGKFKTAPSGQASFTIGFGSCTDGGDSAALAALHARNPDLFLHAGDLGYWNIIANDQAAFRTGIDARMALTNHKNIFGGRASAYVWSDHDFGDNNAVASSLSNAAANAVYRQFFPHYPLTAESGSLGIYQTFVWGRVRFILTDNRSFKNPTTGTVLGSAQKTVFKNEITNATEPLIIWVNENPWIGDISVGDDEWFGPNYITERDELGTYIGASGKRVVMLSGDMHGLAYDNGSSSEMSPGGNSGTTGGGIMMVCHAAPFRNLCSQKGGPYSGGIYPSSGSVSTEQYGFLTITDNGTSITVDFKGYDSGDVQRMSGVKTLDLSSGVSKSGNEAFALTETAAVQRLSTVVDSWSIGEASSPQAQALRTDVFTMSEVAAASEQAAKSATESAAMSEAASSQAQASVSEGHTISDPTPSVAASPSASDAQTQTEGTSTVGTGLSASDSWAMNEGTSNVADVTAKNASDSETTSESSSMSAAASVNDSLTMSEQTPSIQAAIQASEATVLNEASQIGSDVLKTAFDSSTVTDSVLTLANALSAADNLVFSDASSVLANAVGSDALALSEASVVVSSVFKLANDSASLIEGLGVIASQILASDALTVSEVSVLTATALLNASDMFTFGELAQVGGPASPYVHMLPPMRGFPEEVELSGLVQEVVNAGLVSDAAATGVVAANVASAIITAAVTHGAPEDAVADAEGVDYKGDGVQV